MTSSVWENIEVAAEASVPIVDVQDASESGESVIASVDHETGIVTLKTLVAGDGVTLTTSETEVEISTAGSSSSSSTNITPYKFTATASQTQFIVSEYVTDTTCHVWVNGIKLSIDAGDFVVDEGTSTIQVSENCVGGERVEIWVFESTAPV